MKEQIQITSISDGELANADIINEFEIGDLCADGKYNFVGFINKRNKILVSCPKHFEFRDESDIKLIIRCILKSLRTSDKGSSELIDCNIPFRPYLQVLEYYNRYGLFKKITKNYEQGYSGNVDWNRTIRKSQRVVSEGNLLFLPLEVKRTFRQDTFISDCMRYVLNDGYDQFGRYAGVGEKIDVDGFEFNFKNTEAVIKQLKDEEGKYFRDSEIQLIRALLEYFKWEGSLTEKSFFVTQSFDLSWENMVHSYLNMNYFGYDLVNQKMIFKNGCRKYVFRKVSRNIESPSAHHKNHKFHVEYDHLLEEAERTTVFDSKYYQKVSEVNYKQVAYHYFLMSGSDGKKVSAKNIVNGLILPTEGKYYSCVHVDRSDLDGVYIREHYINLREVMEKYAAKR